MLKSQQIQLNISKARTRLNKSISDRNALPETESPTQEMVTEMDEATRALETLEVEFRATVATETEEGEAEESIQNLDAEGRERRELREKVQVSNHVAAALESRALDGPELEYNQEIGLRKAGAFPLELLAPEERATTNVDSQAMARPWVDRLFAETAAMRLGITFESVAPGVVSFPVVTGGASGAQRGRKQVTADGAWVVKVLDLKPTRNAVRAVFSEEDAMRLPGLEEALRRDLSLALAEATDRVIFTGDETANEDAGDIKGLTTIADVVDVEISQANKLLGDGVLTALAALIDGKSATTTADLNVVLSTGAYRLWLATKSGTHSAIDTTVLEFLIRAGIVLTSRGEISTVTTANAWGGFVGLNRGIEGAGVAAVWNAGTLTRDPYSAAAKGEIALTLSYFWNFGLPRPGNFARVKFA